MSKVNDSLKRKVEARKARKAQNKRIRQQIVTANLPIGIEGEYKLTVHRTDDKGNIIESRDVTDWFNNAILNNGLDYLATGTVPCQYACIGAGSAPVNFADTGLANFTANTSSKLLATVYSRNVSTPPYYVEGQFTYRFAAVGVSRNVTEVGLQTQSASPGVNGNMFSRALVVDSGGNPVTISVAAGEILDISYRYRFFPGSADVTGNVTWTVAGVPQVFTYNVRPVSLGGTYWNIDLTGNFNFRPIALSTDNSGVRGFAKNGVLDSITGSGITNGGNGNYRQWSSASNAAYVSGNYYLDCTFELDPTVGNGINYNVFSTHFNPNVTQGLAVQTSISGTVSKNSSQRLRFNIRIIWGRL